MSRWGTVCINSPYRDYSLRQLKEIVSQYNFEALFMDSFITSPQCYCRYCQAMWKERYGGEIPPGLYPKELLQQLEFCEEVTLKRYYQEVHQILRSHNKTIPTSAHNAGINYAFDGYLSRETNPYGIDYYRSGLEAKLFRARREGKEVEVIGFRTNGILDFTLKPVPTLQWEVATSVAHNCAMMFVDQPFWDGSLDSTTYSALGKAFQVAEELKPHVSGTRPYAEILIVSSERSERLNRGSSLPLRGESERVDLYGAYKIFADLHLPFDICTEKQLLTTDLTRVPMIVVPCSFGRATSKRLINTQRRTIVRITVKLVARA